MEEETNAGCSQLPVLPQSSSTTCAICSLSPPSNAITSSHGEVFCLPCLRYALVEKHQNARYLQVDIEHEDVAVLVQKELSETRREQIRQLQQLEENLEQLKTTVVCALGLRSLEDRAWVDEAIAKERLETRREVAWLERRTLGRL